MTNSSLQDYFIEKHPRETARVLEKYTPDALSDYLAPLPDKLVANLIQYMYPDLAVSCLVIMPPGRSADVLELLGADSAARLLSRMKTDTQNSILDSMSRVTANRLKLVLRYPIGTIGHSMSPNVFIVPEDMQVDEVIHSARSASSEILGDIFIIDEQQVLVGVVDVKSLVLASADEEVRQIMKIPDTVLNVRTNLEYVKDNPRWRFKEVLPVVDQKNVFVGVLKRSVLNEVLSGSQLQQDDGIDLMETVIDVADLFWEVCFSFIQQNTESSPRGNVHDRSKN